MKIQSTNITKYVQKGILCVILILTAAQVHASTMISFEDPFVLSKEESSVTGGANPGLSAAKVKLIRLLSKDSGTHEGRLVVVYSDHNSIHDIWEPNGGTHKADDIFIRYSDDNGISWSNPINISNTAQYYSQASDIDGDSELEEYYGNSEKPTLFSSGDNLAVSWTDKYCPENGKSETSHISTIQGITSYEDLDVSALQRTVPFSCVYAAISNDGGESWNTLQITYGRRDATQDVIRGSGTKWVMTWQEDPAGLQEGEAEGPGEGSSGARVTQGTDIWYTYTDNIITNPTALRDNRIPLTDHSKYDVTGSNGYPMTDVAGSLSIHGSSRANLHIIKDGSVFKALVAYEETKAEPELEGGKTIQYHSFEYNHPIQNGIDTERYGSNGTTLSNSSLNARRVRFLRQSPNGSRPALAIFWREGLTSHGGPADIMLKTSVSLDESSVQSATSVNISANTPTATNENLSDDPEDNPLENSLAHRGILSDNFIAIGFSYTPDGELARDSKLATFDFYIRRSFDGGTSWTSSVNLTNLPQNPDGSYDLSIKEPRIVQPPTTGSEDENVFAVVWSTETHGIEGVEEAQPQDIFVTRTTDLGESYEQIIKLPGLFDDDPDEFESQIQVNEDASEIYAVWMTTADQTDALFAFGEVLFYSYCGDEIVEGTEECDDGNLDNTDSCTNACVFSFCGDGIVQAGAEECDDTNSDDTDSCLNNCIAARCGDGIVRINVESCDDGNQIDGDECQSSCALPTCGDEILDEGEECDDGNLDNTDSCLSTCVNSNCGDGFLETDVEECDDENFNDQDECLNNCMLALCGDGVVLIGDESCDDGNLLDGDGCNLNCLLPACGDGIIDSGEECDDGNISSSDGCSASCLIETTNDTSGDTSDDVNTTPDGSSSADSDNATSGGGGCSLSSDRTPQNHMILLKYVLGIQVLLFMGLRNRVQRNME